MRRNAVRSFLQRLGMRVLFLLLASVLATATLAQTLQWIRQFGTAGEDGVESVAADASGVYAVGYTEGSLPGQTSAGRKDAFVRKYDTNGNVVWTHQFGTAADDEARGVAVDASEVYVAGETHGTLAGQTGDGSWDAFLCKYDANGNLLWTRQFGSENVDGAWQVAVDATGVYVVGETKGIFAEQPYGGFIDAFVRKYDFNGNVLWTRQFGSVSDDQAYAVAAHDTAVYVVGETNGTLPGQVSTGVNDAYVRKYDSNGTELWTRQFGSRNFVGVEGAAADATGVYVVGRTDSPLPGQTSAGERDPYVRKYDASGNVAWTRQFGDQNSQGASGAAADGSGVYVLASARGANLWKYDINGNVVWSRDMGRSGEGVAVNAGDVYIGGVLLPLSATRHDAYVAKVGTAGACIYSIIPTSQSFPTSGGRGSVSVTAASGCTWNAISSASWISITSGSNGSGIGTVSYSVAPNTGGSRAGTLMIAGLTFTITQLGTAPPLGSAILMTLTPNSVLEAEPEFVLRLNGTGFQRGALVQFGGANRLTTYVSSTQLQVRILTSEVLTPGTLQVTVAQQGNISNALPFRILADNHPPLIGSLLPPSGATLGNTKVTIPGNHFKPELGTTTVINPIIEALDGGQQVFQQVPGEGVFVGGMQVTQVVFVNRTQLQIITLPHAAGSADVRVAQSTGSATLPSAYMFNTLSPVPPPAGLPPNRLQIPFVADDFEFRTNLGINNPGAVQASVDILLVDANGLVVAQKSVSVPPNGMVQMNNVVQQLEGASGVTGREGYLVLGSRQHISAWASQIDNATLDPSMELARAESTSARRVLLPSSVSNSRFLTSLVVINTSYSAGDVTISARDLEGRLRQPVLQQRIPGKGYLFFPDFYQTLKLTDVFGPIEIEGAEGVQLQAAERIYTREHTSAYFEGVDISSASRSVTLPYSVDTADFRTNLGVNNVAGTAATVTVRLVGKEGLAAATMTITVPPNGMTQTNDVNRQLLGTTVVSNREGTLWLESNQPIIAWTSQIDNVTQDPSTFKSTLAVVNLSASPTSVQIKAWSNEGQVNGVSAVSIPGQGLITYDDILASLELAGTFGPLEITSQDGRPLLAVSRVYSTQRTGGYFEGVPASPTP